MRYPHRPTAYDDDWEDVPAQGFWPQWFGGVALPLAVMGYGVYGLVTGTALLPGRNTPGLVLHGAAAVALSVALIGAGVFLHCHYFWGNVYHLHWLATLGKVAGLSAFIGCMGYVIARSFVG